MHGHGRSADHVSADQAFGLKLAQPFAEQPVGQARYDAQQLVKAPGPGDECAQDRTSPAAPDQFDGAVEARTKPR